MMKKTKLVQLTGLVVLFFIAMMSCNQESAKSNTAAMKDFSKVAQAYVDSFNNKDAAAVSMLFTEDGSQLPPAANTVTGRENIQKFLEAGIENGATNLQVEPLSAESKGDLGYGIGNFQYDLLTKDGKMTTVKGKYVTIMKKMSNGKWLMKYHIYNYDPAPAPATEPAPEDSI